MRGKRTNGNTGRATAVALAALVLAGSWLGQVAPPAAAVPAAVVPGANGRIVFESDRDGDVEIYTVAPQGELGKRGTPAKQLTRNRAYDLYPAWSPNGKQIAFMGDRNGNNEIYVMDTDGSHQRRLTNTGARDEMPAWSPDGTKIAFTSNRDGNDEIYVMNALDGANQTNLTKNPGNDYLPSWDPDPKNQIIAFASSRDGNSEIYVMDTNGNFQFNLTRNPGGDFDRR